jgi:excinuclease UvrABC nuclease subunit
MALWIIPCEEEIIKQSSLLEIKGGKVQYEEDDNKITIAADPVVQYMSKEQLKKAVEEAKRLMKKAANDTDFMSAAQYRDEMFALKNLLKEKSKQWMNIIDGVIENIEDEDMDTAKELVDKYKKKLKKYRTCGLEKDGEYSTENLVFKILRRNGYIEKLHNLATTILDKKLSMKQ